MKISFFCLLFCIIFVIVSVFIGIIVSGLLILNTSSSNSIVNFIRNGIWQPSISKASTQFILTTLNSTQILSTAIKNILQPPLLMNTTIQKPLFVCNDITMYKWFDIRLPWQTMYVFSDIAWHLPNSTNSFKALFTQSMMIVMNNMCKVFGKPGGSNLMPDAKLLLYWNEKSYTKVTSRTHTCGLYWKNHLYINAGQLNKNNQIKNN